MNIILLLMTPLSMSIATLSVDVAYKKPPLVKEPKYQSQPRYGLLVYGGKGKTRIWMVMDRERLFVDYNGNGILGEVKEVHQSKELNYSLGAIPNTAITEFRLTAKKKKVGLTLMILATMEGKYKQGVGFFADDPLVFSTDPKNAPVIHLGGPLQMKISGTPTLKRGKTSKIYAMIGTPGQGAGTFAAVHYKSMPKGLNPSVEVSFPSGKAGKAIKKTIALTGRF